MGSKTKNRLVDALYLALAIVPFLLAMTLKAQYHKISNFAISS